MLLSANKTTHFVQINKKNPQSVCLPLSVRECFVTRRESETCCVLPQVTHGSGSSFSTLITTRKRSLDQGNIFSSLCQEFCTQGVFLSACWETPSPQSRHPWEQTPPQTRHPVGPGIPWEQMGADTPPCVVHAGRYGQQAGGMHPTGMQSCSRYFRKKIKKDFFLRKFSS